jgi:murein L,D-transpeptidase YcbB/YkuD
VFNPTWTVPPTILKHDIAPAARRDPNYVTRKGLQVIDRNGKVVSPRSVNWSGSIPYTLRQPGGPDNALGRVKFMFPNPYAVYLHDTPAKGLFASEARAASSGCVRIERPFELAERLLGPQDPSWTAAKITSTVDSLQTVTARLAKPVPVLLSYWTAWVASDGVLNFRKDIYDRDPTWLKALDAPLG